jgi:hypothetical protein
MATQKKNHNIENTPQKMGNNI